MILKFSERKQVRPQLKSNSPNTALLWQAFAPSKLQKYKHNRCICNAYLLALSQLNIVLLFLQNRKHVHLVTILFLLLPAEIGVQRICNIFTSQIKQTNTNIKKNPRARFILRR